MQSEDPNDRKIGILQGIKSYAIALAMFALACVLAWNFDWPGEGISMVALYLGIGVWLGRSVFNRMIEWHPVYNTLENVSRVKLNFIGGWIFYYPFLFWRLWVAKVL